MNIYAFDVDHTLEYFGGPVTLQSIIDLRNQGHIVGLYGNFAGITMNFPDWHRLFSFIGQMRSTSRSG